MAGDQQAALFGQMALKRHDQKYVRYRAFIVMNTGEEPQLSDNDLLTTIGYGINGKVYYALKVVFLLPAQRSNGCGMAYV